MSKKVLQGTVVSNKMIKTAVVAVEVPKKHKIYGKAIKNTRRFKARAENPVEIGDVVMIEETKPFSKEVTWIIIRNITQEEK